MQLTFVVANSLQAVSQLKPRGMSFATVTYAVIVHPFEEEFFFFHITTISTSAKLKIWVCCIGKKEKNSRIHVSCEKRRRKKDKDINQST